MTSSSENLSEEGISTFFVAFSALLTLVLVLSVSCQRQGSVILFDNPTPHQFVFFLFFTRVF